MIEMGEKVREQKRTIKEHVENPAPRSAEDKLFLMEEAKEETKREPVIQSLCQGGQGGM